MPEDGAELRDAAFGFSPTGRDVVASGKSLGVGFDRWGRRPWAWTVPAVRGAPERGDGFDERIERSRALRGSRLHGAGGRRAGEMRALSPGVAARRPFHAIDMTTSPSFSMRTG